MPMRDYSLPGSRTDQLMLTERQLLQSVVECARYVFDAAACSVFLLDKDTGDLVFEAVAGEGADHLPGARFPRGTGIVGWVAMTGEPLLVEDLKDSAVFSTSAAESTGYVPGSLMAAPLIQHGYCIGVLEILDRGPVGRGELADLDLLGLVSSLAAISLDLLIRLREALPAGGTQPGIATDGIEERLDRMRGGFHLADPAPRALALKLLDAVNELLGDHSNGFAG
jgi:GAF domain-containing protein